MGQQEAVECNGGAVFGQEEAAAANLRGEFVLAFNTTMCLGSEKDKFNHYVEITYGSSTLDDEKVKNLFQVYEACANTSPDYVSRNKTKPRRRAPEVS